MADQLPTRAENFSEWYNTIVQKADLADYGAAKGTMIIKPYGYALWENIQAYLDKRFKRHGAKNAFFPTFIPLSVHPKRKRPRRGLFTQSLACDGGRRGATGRTVCGASHIGNDDQQHRRQLDPFVSRFASAVESVEQSLSGPVCARVCFCARPSSCGKKGIHFTRRGTKQTNTRSTF